jgi:hypothetical protein
MREKRIVYRILVGKPEGKKPRGRARRRWGVILRKQGGGGMEWIDFAQEKE